MECKEAREYLPSYADGSRTTEVDEHLQTCASCRAEVEDYREIAAQMSTLAADAIEPPAWLLGTLTETVTEKARRQRSLKERRDQVLAPKVLTGGALIAAGVAGALMVRNRRRRKGIGRRLRQALAEG